MKDFVAIDFETANYEPTSICSVGLVVVRGGEVTHRVHRLVCPEPDYYVRRFSEEIHGIFPADTCHAPNFGQVWREVSPLVEGLRLVAHNKSFDERVLRATCRMYGIDYVYGNFLCTLTQARRVIPRTAIENYRLPTVCAYLGIPFDHHHNALADAEGCARIAMRLWPDDDVQPRLR